MTEQEPPKHAFELTIRIGGEDWIQTVRELERLTDHVIEHGPRCTMVSGGSYVRIEIRDVTPEAYRKELNAWLKQQRVR